VESPRVYNRKVTVWLDDETVRRIRVLAMARDVSMSAFIRTLIQYGLQAYDIVYGLHKESET